MYIIYRLGGSLFNLRRLRAQTKTFEHLIRNLPFADDATVVAHTERERALQCIRSGLEDAAQVSGLEVSLTNTEVLHQPAPRVEYRPPHITIGDTELKAAVQQFTYLGRTISTDARIDKKMDNRLAKTNRAFGSLYTRVWNNIYLKNSTKISVYRAVVLMTPLYGSEYYVTCRSRLRLLERFHQRCLRTILSIHWSDFITNIDVLKRTGITSTEAMLLKSRLQWARYVSRMEDHHLPKIIMYGVLATGHRHVGAPKKHFKDFLKKSLVCSHIGHCQWSTLAADRGSWRLTITMSASFFENSRRINEEEKRRRKQHAAMKRRNVDNPDLQP